MNPMENLHVVETDKPIDEACAALEKAVIANQFGVLHVHDIQETMRKKGVDFQRPLRVFDVCNPQQAKAVLDHSPYVSAVLPCAISVFADGGKTVFSFVRPSMMLALFGADELKSVAEEVEASMTKIVEAAAS